MKKFIKLLGMLVRIITLGGCAGMSDTTQRSVTGSLIGAGAGGIIVAIAGNAWMERLGAGTAQSEVMLYSKHKESEDEAYQRGVADGRQAR